MKKTWLALILLIFLFSFGCYGIQQPAECTAITNPMEQMSCYKRAAVNYAYGGDEVGVKVMCNQIEKVGESYGQKGYTDMQKNAVLEKNRCYYESAKIIATTQAKQSALSMCEEITETRSVFGLSYADATREGCKNEVKKLLQFSPENYYTTPGNLCSLSGFFVILLTAFFFRSIVHNL